MVVVAAAPDGPPTGQQGEIGEQPVPARTLRAERTQGDRDQVRALAKQRVVVQPQPLETAGRLALEQQVGGRDEPPEGVAVGNGWIVTCGMTTGEGVKRVERSNGVGDGNGVIVGATGTTTPPPPEGGAMKAVVGVAVGGMVEIQARV